MGVEVPETRLRPLTCSYLTNGRTARSGVALRLLYLMFSTLLTMLVVT